MNEEHGVNADNSTRMIILGIRLNKTRYFFKYFSNAQIHQLFHSTAILRTSDVASLGLP